MPRISSRNVFLLLLMMIVIAVVVVISVSPLLIDWYTYRANTRQWKYASRSHDVPVNAQFEELWNITAYIGCKTCLMSKENNVYLSGSLQNNSPEYLINLDLLTGNVKWQHMLQNNQTLEGFDSENIYISQSSTRSIGSPTQLLGAAEIIAYDIHSRNEVWRRKFAGSWDAPINRIIEAGLVVDSGPGFYLVDDETGEIINGPQEEAILSDDEEVQYLLGYDARPILQGVDVETEEILWTYDELAVFAQFIFEDELILFGNNVSGEFGGATAIDGRTGKVLWQHARVISNVAVSNGVAYFIKLDEGIWGQGRSLGATLLAVDICTGETIGALRFEPNKIRSEGIHYEYIVSATDDIVLVYLGDGRQLIALRSFVNK